MGLALVAHGKSRKKKKKRGIVVRTFAPEPKLKRRIRAHFKKLGFTRADDGTLVVPGDGKDDVRRLHAGQRAERLKLSAKFLSRALEKALPHFADGREIDASKIRLCLVRVDSETEEADLFRVATLTWSVPVSPGFGRRLRYLVWDSHHQRIAGVIALGDPVYNLSVRDDLIGWDVDDRAERLVNVLDAYVLGAVPPYNMLLGGKAVACLVRSREIYNDFKKTYGSSVGIISGEAKRASLLAVTTTSSMGRSSVYNRLRLGDTEYFSPIGYTTGWGHFHITDELFGEIRDYLRLTKHPYTDQHKFGDGPNWRLRAIRAAFDAFGIKKAGLRHGVKREVFICQLCSNALAILKTGSGRPKLAGLQTVGEISELARERWMVPRADRRPEYLVWQRGNIRNLIRGTLSAANVPAIIHTNASRGRANAR